MNALQQDADLMCLRWKEYFQKVNPWLCCSWAANRNVARIEQNAPATNVDPMEPTHLGWTAFNATQHFEPKGPAVVERLMAYMCSACKVYSHP